MSVLVWDKPKKKMAKAEWETSAGFDGGPVGGYVPNMSDDDMKAWKAKITGTKLGFPQVEIRKSTSGGQMVIIVNLGKGYNYKHYRSDYGEEKRNWGTYDTTATGVNVHIALNGPALLSFAEMTEMAQAVEEAKSALEALKGDSK